MREVGVHLEDALGAHLEGTPEPGDVGLAEALLRVAMEHRDVGEVTRELVGDLAGAVRRVVVDDERMQGDALAVRDLADTGHRVTDVLSLVVGGEDDDVHGPSISPSGRGSLRAVDRRQGQGNDGRSRERLSPSTQG